MQLIIGIAIGIIIGFVLGLNFPKFINWVERWMFNHSTPGDYDSLEIEMNKERHALETMDSLIENLDDDIKALKKTVTNFKYIK